MSQQHEVFILIYEYKSGCDISAYGSQAEREAELVDIVRSQWSDRADKSAPDDSAQLDDAAAVEAYFFGNEEESFLTEDVLVPFEDDADPLPPPLITDQHPAPWRVWDADEAGLTAVEDACGDIVLQLQDRALAHAVVADCNNRSRG